MNDDRNNIIDVEAVEIEDSDNLPAVVETPTHEPAAPIEGRDWSTYSRPERRCTAHSSRTGDQCKNVAILNSSVCRYHGGAAKQVKQAARIRLENAADLMAKQLLGIALTADSEGVKLTAIRDALDRAGLKAPSEVVLSQAEAKPYESVFDAIGGDAGDAGFPSAASDDFGSAGQNASPAPAYDTCGNGSQADAGGDGSPYSATGYDNDLAASYPEGSEPSHDESPRQGRPRLDDRDTQPQPREGRPSQRTPGRREVHVTGMDAIRMANEANRAIGAMPDQLALETRHKRYPRP